MREEFLPFSKPSISELEIQAVVDVLRSGWITTGKKCAEFEGLLSEYIGCPGAVALTSATAGMHLLLKALNIGPGDEVITPSLTWVSTINLITLCGATPVFADVDRNNLMITPESIEARITSKTKLIIPVHYAGAPYDIDAVRQLAATRNIPVIDDAAHAIGTYYKGKHIGSTGTSIFSFHPIKNITTGEGGMFCSDDQELLAKIRRLKFHGLGEDAYNRETQGRSPFSEVLEPGYKYNLTDFAAAMGIVQLKRFDELQEHRSEMAALYLERLREIEEIIPLSQPTYSHKHAWHLFIVRVDSEKARISRDDFMIELKKRNIGTGLHFRGAHLNKYYRDLYGRCEDSLPNTVWNSDRICSLPLFPDMKEKDLDDVIFAIKDVLNSASA